MKKLLTTAALAGALLAAPSAFAGELKSPIFGKAVASVTTADQNKSTVGKGYYADLYGFYGNYYNNIAGYYGIYGSYYKSYSYYYSAYTYSGYATNYYYYAYYYQYYGS